MERRLQQSVPLIGNATSLYRKRLFVFDGTQPQGALIRNYTSDDFAALIRIQQESFPPPFPAELWWNEEQLLEHITRFPAGALCVELDGEVVGSITALLMQYEPGAAEHNWAAITDNGYIRNHQPEGDTLYIVDVCIRPTFRKLGLGMLLMQAMYQLTVQLGLTRLLGGGRMPGYHKVANLVTIDQYVQGIVEGRFKDPVISFMMRCGRTPVQVVPNYLEDEESCNYGLLMEWSNPFNPIGDL